MTNRNNFLIRRIQFGYCIIRDAGKTTTTTITDASSSRTFAGQLTDGNKRARPFFFLISLCSSSCRTATPFINKPRRKRTRRRPSDRSLSRRCCLLSKSDATEQKPTDPLTHLSHSARSLPKYALPSCRSEPIKATRDAVVVAAGTTRTTIEEERFFPVSCALSSHLASPPLFSPPMLEPDWRTGGRHVAG